MSLTALWLLTVLLSCVSLYKSDDDYDYDYDDDVGIRWAILIAGSQGYINYRHQADVCHAYQILKKGGLRDENIVVFMYDDIAYHESNPTPGVIINRPHGSDVYEGVPKDYTGEDVNADNFYAAFLGNKTAIKGGSGKVVEGELFDRIFIYYSGHGNTGFLSMPSGPSIRAMDLVDALKKKHASSSYKSLVFYLESCKAGSIFEGLLPEDIAIYATTASNPEENSFGAYCPGDPSIPPNDLIGTCMGNSYSVAWMEDCDVHNLHAETLKQQYEHVQLQAKVIVGNRFYPGPSHVMQYGNLNQSSDFVSTYIGSDPANGKSTFEDVDSLSLQQPAKYVVKQSDASLLHLWDEFLKAPEGSTKKLKAQKQIEEEMSQREHVDSSIEKVVKLIFGNEKGIYEMLNRVRPSGQPVVDDWDCFKSLIDTFESFCGSLSYYGLKHTGVMANMCNAGITKDQMAEAAGQACGSFP